MAIDKSDPKDMAIIQEMIDEAVTGLKTKNIDLAARLEKARKGTTIDPDEYKELEQRAAKAEDDLKAATKALKAATGDLEITRKAHESESEFTKRLLVDNGLVDALTKAGVTNPVNLKAAKAMLKDGVTLVIDGDTRKAMIGDKDLNEGILAWAGSDEGKHFIAAPANSGGGAQGSGKPASADIMKLPAKDRMDAGRKSA
jgi:hypothetical protein